jgi:hypothetical protein
MYRLVSLTAAAPLAFGMTGTPAIADDGGVFARSDRVPFPAGATGFISDELIHFREEAIRR